MPDRESPARKIGLPDSQEGAAMRLTVEGFDFGSFVIRRGSVRDYLALEHLHYLPRRPVFNGGVWTVVFRDWRSSIRNCRSGRRRARARPRERIVAVGVVAYPTPR